MKYVTYKGPANMAILFLDDKKYEFYSETPTEVTNAAAEELDAAHDVRFEITDSPPEDEDGEEEASE